MAYVDKQPLSHRLANLGTAGLIELGIAVALIAGLSTTFAPQADPGPIIASNIPIDPVTPEPPAPTDPIDTPITVLTPPIVLDPIPDPYPTSPVIDPPLTPTVPRGGDTPTTQPSAQVSPAYTPAGPTPRNDPAEWVTPNDYPARDLREGNQGTTRFRVIVGSNGRVSSCETIGSSGFASLDKVTCERITRRARFNPAIDETGAKVVGSYSNAVVWRIPR